MSRTPFHLLVLPELPIFQQLQIEEALLRTDNRNWCILNTGSPEAVVMGISAKPEKLIDLEKAKQQNIPLIRRFSGGGTVLISPSTVFATLICNASDCAVPPQPKAIMEWSETLYRPLFPSFSLRENDYVIGEKKFGGNAQYIQKNRWLHHTSFLWDYDPKRMEVLLLPEKRPAYRMNRSHADFLCTLKPIFPDKKELLASFRKLFHEKLGASEMEYLKIRNIIDSAHRKATEKISLA